MLARRSLPPCARSAKVATHVVDFERIEAAGDLMAVDAAFCALGTTMAQAGTRDRFRRVDYGYVLSVARLALERGARHFLLVSAVGANARSRLFYNHVKGETEEAVGALDFPALTIVRPSLLLGERVESRLGERILGRLGFLVPRRYKPVPAAAVAEAMVRAAIDDLPGVRVIESADIRDSARRARG